MSLFAIGDIHGCGTALLTLVERVPMTSDDTVITLGDYVDRGPQSRQVLDWVMERTATGKCIPLRGNHEIMMLDAIFGRMPMGLWLQYGGKEALDSYAAEGERGVPEEIPQSHLQFIESQLLPYYESETHIFVHASVEPQFSLAEQIPDSLYWTRFNGIRPHRSGKTIICGHTAQKSGLPANVGHAVCIDTWACGDGWLTCLNVDTGEYFQAKNTGEFRLLNLDQTQ
ncbi:metallophosphoesterase family protein [Planctomicrobium sp. SH668]|uniref:metallophosphoesterase family protein n=1 Tax=Planctomicrobium sp. SH668 TaxID=3448126 RepID=UPI003F5B6B99